MKVSVITPTCNRPSLLERAIISFMSQEYQDKELLILVNGEYTDETIAVCEKYASLHSGIKWEVSSKKRGEVFNRLWEMCEGELICQLHDDDLFFDKHSISIRVQEFFKNEFVEVVYGGVVEQDIHCNPLATHFGQRPSPHRSLWNEYINFTTMMWKRSIRNKFMFEGHLTYSLDNLFKIRCMMECCVAAISTPVMRYTIHEEQETRIGRMNGLMEEENLFVSQMVKELYRL